MTKFNIVYEGNLRTRSVHDKSHDVLLTDAPLDNKGKGEHFSPTDLLGIALGSCVLTLMGIAANRLGISIDGTQLSVEKTMKAAPARMIDKLILHISCQSPLDAKVIQELEKAAKGCPVHHSLHPDIIQEFHFSWKTV